MSSSRPAADPVVGKRLSEKSFVVSDTTLNDYYSGLNLQPRSSGEVPSTIASGPDNGYFAEIAFPNHMGHLWMRQGWECFGRLQIGERYRVSGVIREIYERRDRSVVNYEVVLHDAGGQMVLRTNHHQSFLNEQPSGGEVTFRDPGKKPGARKFVIPPGDRFGGLQATITLEMCGHFFHGDANYHTDPDSSRELGFTEVVVGGRMTMAYVAHILEDRFGEAWWQTGKLDLKFTNPVWANDLVTAHGVETGVLDEDPDRIGAFVWLSKPDDTVVLIANASVRR
ncbi:MAG: MaoC family dehydratase [Proteobacteria bacterium]|nr:MaoC family dehydratase [Pseudomonadota bacterium]